jgi:glycogen synthase
MAAERRLRLLMTADPVGGVWTYALELLRAFGQDADILLASMGAPLGADQQAEIEALPHVTLHTGRWRLEWMEDPWDDVRQAGEWLLALARAFRPDLVHLNGYAHGALPWEAPVLMVAHSCVFSRWQAVKGERAPARWERYRRAVQAGLRAADLVVAPSAAMRDAIRRHYGVDAGVCWNGRDPARFRPRPKEPLILGAGRLWDEAKNLGALAAVADALPWPVAIAGDRHSPDGRTTPPAPPAVRQLGRLASSELAGWMGRAAIYALPARYEPFGLSPVEAAFSGCALVLGDIPSLREVWGNAARYVPPDDHAALRDTLARLCGAPAERRRLAQAARERAHVRYTAGACAARYRALYAGLVGRPLQTEACLCAS